MRASIFCLLVVGCGVAPAAREPIAVSREEALRPTDTASTLMWRYQSGDVVESAARDGGTFRVHFTRAGVNAVPGADVDDSGVPDFVEQVEDAYEAVGALYHGPLGFRPPLADIAVTPNGGDGRFDVYLLDFARAADGAFRVDQCPTAEQCVGYVVQENDFVGYGYPSTLVATRILGSHEYFHAVQAAYDNAQDVVVSEGTAVWATERFDPGTDDFENFIHGYLERPDRSLDSPPPGPVPTFAYGSAIFFRFLTERHDDALIRKLWERLENGQGAPSEPANQANPTWLVQLDALLAADYQSSFAAEFAEFARWNLYTGTAADPAQSYTEGSRYPQVALTSVTLPTANPGTRVFYASTQYFTSSAGARTRMTAAIVDSAFTTTDDREDMVVWLASRQAGRNTELVRLTANETVDVTGGEIIVAVVNTRRAAVGAALSQRPALCIGTPEEVASCVTTFGGSPADAGVDAGTPTMDAGAEPDAGVTEPPPPAGCGCGMGSGPLLFLALAIFRLLLGGRR